MDIRHEKRNQRIIMPKKLSYSFFFSFFLFLATGCALKPPAYTGITYPAINQAEITFQEKGIPAQCKAIAHIIVHTPKDATGTRIGQKISDYAKGKGADLILIGLSRKNSGRGTSDFQFFSYGPKQDYLFNKGWLGWKFGVDNWEDGGSMVGFGYNSLSDTSANDYSMKIQAVFLRCASVPPAAGHQ
jgi:hypothetical protein